MLSAALAAILAPAAFAPPAQLPVAPSVLPLAVPLEVVCSNPPPGNLPESGVSRSSVPRDPCGLGPVPILGLGGSATAYWSLDDQFWGATANYESQVGDNTLDLSVTGGPRRAPPAARMPSARFVDGNSEFLSIADPWTSGDIDFAVGCWVYLDDLTGDLPIASKDDGTQREWRLYFDDNTTDAWVFEIFDGAGGGRGTVSSSEVPAATTWTFVVGAHDATGNLVGVSVNGAAYTTAATSGVAVDTDDPVELGRMAAATYHDGRLSQCFFIKEYLSTADLGDLYSNGVPVPSRGFPFRVATAPEALWDLGERSGTRADFTANGHDLADNATVLYAAGLAPRAYDAAHVVEASDQHWSGPATPLTAQKTTLHGWARQTPSGAAQWSGILFAKVGVESPNFAELSEFYLLRESSSQTLKIFAGEGDGLGTCNAASPILPFHEWFSYTATIDPDDLEVSIQTSGSASRTTTACTGFNQKPSTDLLLGRWKADNGAFNWQGDLGMQAIWLSELTEAQHLILNAGGGGYTCETLPDQIPNPIACWNLPDTTNRGTGGSAWDLTAVNTPTTADGISDIPGGVSRRAAQAVHTANEYLEHVGGGTVLDVGADVAFAVEAWVRIDDSSGSEYLVYKGNGGITAADFEYQLRGSGSPAQWGFEFSDGTDIRTAQGTGDDLNGSDGLWQHVVGVFDPTADLVHVYVDGLETDNTATSTSFPQDINEDLRFFARDTLDGSMTMAAVAFWKGGTALSAANVRQLWNGGDPVPCDLKAAFVGQAPVECFPLDEASGNRTGSIAGIVLTDVATVGSAGGPVRGNTGHAADYSPNALQAYGTVTDPTAAPLEVDEPQSLTVTGWAKVPDSTASRYLFGKRASGAQGYSAYLSSTPQLVWWVGNATTSDSIVLTLPDGDDVWFHYTLYYDAENDEIGGYINGVAGTPVSFSDGIVDGSHDWSIGRPGENATAGFYSEHLQDEVIVLVDFVPSQAQALCLYNDHKGRSPADLRGGFCSE